MLLGGHSGRELRARVEEQIEGRWSGLTLSLRELWEEGRKAEGRRNKQRKENTVAQSERTGGNL